MENKKRVLILGNSHLVVFKFRGELIEKLVEQGCDVWVSFPNGPFGEGEESAKKYRCHFVESCMERRGTNPLKDISLICRYALIIKKISPDIVLTYTVKPDIYGGIVCNAFRIPYMPNITGLGKALDEGGIIQILTIWLYKHAVKNAKCVFFQNNYDRTFFDKHKIKYKKEITLPGSGVNLKKFQPLPYPNDTEPVRFIYISRVMKAKGIEQFFDAAHAIKLMYPTVEFHICGYCEEDYKEELESRIKNGEIIYHGLVDNVQEYVEKCHCVVLPSFHPEGVSNVLLEGAALGRPLITTNHTGCAETVTDGVTGFIVKQRSSDDLIEKMTVFINMTNDERRQMGVRGREKVEKIYDRNIVVEKYIQEISKA